ncbi:hypothetical protein PFISCL1PPCAC_18516, partial [Pristionchus fissidentatus]
IVDAIKWNEHESHISYFNKRPFKECENDPEGAKMRDGYSTQWAYECIWKPKRNATATIDILIVGNSISHRASKILYPILRDNEDIRMMRLFAHSACKPIEGICPPFFAAMMKLVERMKPDITFLIYDDSKRLREPITDIANDKPVQDFVDFLKPLTTHSKYVVLDEFYPHASTGAGVAASMYKRLLRNQTIDDLKGLYEPFVTSYSYYFRRLDTLPAHYPNLIRHNTSGPLCAEQPGWCWWYNRRNLHSYFTDNLHLTADGLERERESYEAIVDHVLEKVK